jgi:hypothetical protein
MTSDPKERKGPAFARWRFTGRRLGKREGR